MSEHIVKIDKNLCVGCGACIKDCIGQNIALNEGKAEVLSNKCIFCGHCVAVCPKNAVCISGFSDKTENAEYTTLNPDDVYGTIKFRRSIRQFKPDEIPDDIVNKIIDVGRLTHTAANSQNVSIIVLKDKRKEAEKIAVNLFRQGKKLIEPFSKAAKRIEIGDEFFFFNAPVVFVIASESKTNGCLAASNMEFYAEANGLGVLYSGFFCGCVNKSPKLKKLLQLPKGKKAVATLVMGYPNVKYYHSAPRNNADVKFI